MPSSCSILAGYTSIQVVNLLCQLEFTSHTLYVQPRHSLLIRFPVQEVTKFIMHGGYVCLEKCNKKNFSFVQKHASPSKLPSISSYSRAVECVSRSSECHFGNQTVLHMLVTRGRWYKCMSSASCILQFRNTAYLLCYWLPIFNIFQQVKYKLLPWAVTAFKFYSA